MDSETVPDLSYLVELQTVRQAYGGGIEASL